MYRATVDFTEPMDNGHVYQPGDDFPRAGYFPNADRVAYLLSSGTSFNRPVIEPMAETQQEDIVEKEADPLVPENTGEASSEVTDTPAAEEPAMAEELAKAETPSDKAPAAGKPQSKVKK